MASAGGREAIRYERDAALDVATVNGAYAWADWPQREAWRIEAASARSTWFAARTGDGRVVGVVRVVDDGGLYASLWDLLVDPGWRARGIGRRLVALALEACRDRRLVTLVATPMARGLLGELGFVGESHGHAAMYLRPRPAVAGPSDSPGVGRDAELPSATHSNPS
jgi:GNAT superfamily N-acetyltransferase